MSESAIKVAYLVLAPSTPASVPNGSLFLDSTNGNVLTQKDFSGGVFPIAAGASNPFIRSMVAGEAFSTNKPLSIRPDGKVVLSDSDQTNRTQLIGHSLATSLGDGSVVNVLCISATLVGALNGLGFTSGQNIYMGEATGTYTNDVNTFSGSNDTYIKVGIALPPGGSASAAATDLLVHTEIIGRD
jgi:hypothetical protein